jgi:transposase-like protein
MDYHDYQDMSLEHLAVIREYALDRVHKVTDAMRERARIDYENGVSIKKIARTAGVAVNTVYSWVRD